MGEDAWSRGRQNLAAGATSRMREALAAWVDEDFDRAASSAPMALELAAKVALWSKNPTLLAPLDVKNEAVLVTLATDPNLDSPSLRTIGLRVALSRLTKVLGDLPVTGKRQDRLISCRDGSLHVGTLPRSGDQSAEVVARQVLADSLTLCNFLLPHADVDPADFYGDRLDLVNGLLEAHRGEVEHRVARRLVQAKDRLERWRTHVNDAEVWERAAADLEAGAAEAFPAEDYGSEAGGIEQVCPVCDWKGRLLGRVDVDGDVDVQGGAEGLEVYSYWILTFYPRVFRCNVCKLTLTGPEELEIAGLPTQAREIQEAELGDEFDLTAFTEDMYGSY